MNIDDPGAKAASRSRRGFVVVSTSTGLIVLCSAYFFGAPVPTARANTMVLIWGALAVFCFAALAASRASHPAGTALAALSTYCALNAGFALFVQETMYFAAQQAYESPYRMTVLYDASEAARSFFLIAVVPSGLLGMCWTLAIELFLPGRGAATTATLILACLTLIGALAFNV